MWNEAVDDRVNYTVSYGITVGEQSQLLIQIGFWYDSAIVLSHKMLCRVTEHDGAARKF